MLGFIISIILSYDKERRIDIYLQDQLKDATTQFNVTYSNYNDLSRENAILKDKLITVQNELYVLQQKDAPKYIE